MGQWGVTCTTVEGSAGDAKVLLLLLRIHQPIHKSAVSQDAANILNCTLQTVNQ